TTEVIYVYEKIEEPKPEVEGSVVTKYVDKEGKEIAQRNKTTDKVGKDYTTESKEIPGYKLVEKPKNAEGKYVEGTTEVIYVYEKIEEPKPEVEGSVVTKYVDKDGNEIIPGISTTDKVGNDYKTESKEISGYRLVEKPKNAKGKYVEGSTEVIYVYEKMEEPNVPMNPKDSNNLKEQLKDESLKKEKPILPNTGAKEESLFWAILCIISGLLLIFNRTKKNF
ncbi:MucBP domain-containing protein, partial [Bacillus mobilis]|uniref:MucBP domain-containing protein n=1 Tax=Bacillus mobilis TaxID=2026190 RepID=UPI002E20D52C|nr:MucBP domain-containing protein [Bacillus mobilis]